MSVFIWSIDFTARRLASTQFPHQHQNTIKYNFLKCLRAYRGLFSRIFVSSIPHLHLSFWPEALSPLISHTFNRGCPNAHQFSQEIDSNLIPFLYERCEGFQSWTIKLQHRRSPIRIGYSYALFFENTSKTKTAPFQTWDMFLSAILYASTFCVSLRG